MAEFPEPSDEEIVRRVCAGDAAAAAALFERHLPALRAAARRRLPAALRGRVGESDVVQEAYVAAFLRLGDFEDRGDGSFARWLRGILEHKIAHEARRVAAGKRDAKREIRLATEAEPPAARQRSPSVEAMAGEETVRLRAVVDSLAPDYAAVLRHVHLEGLTLVETARRMDRSADAVDKLYGRALARLADRLRGAADALE